MTAPMTDALRELSAAYALGALDAGEERVFARALPESPELAREVAEYREVAALLATGAPRAALNPSLKQHLLERIATEPQVMGRARRLWPERLAWAAAITGVLLSTALALRTRAIERELAAQRVEGDRARSLLAERENTLNTILGPGTVSFTLSSPAAGQPEVRAFWNRSTNRWILYATALKPAPRGRAYQLWFLQGGKAIPSMTFNTDAGGTALVRAEGPVSAIGLTGAAITEEPESGSPQPTSTPILVGQVQPRD